MRFQSCLCCLTKYRNETKGFVVPVCCWCCCSCPTQVLSLEPAEGASVVGGSGNTGDQGASTAGDGANVSTSQRSIPIVETERPGKVAMSMRAAGMTVVTYISRGEGKANGQGEGKAKGEAEQDTSMQDLVVTLSETSAREIEACSEIDTVRGKVRKSGSGSCLGVGWHKLLFNCVAPCLTCSIEACIPKVMLVFCICGT